MADVYATPPQGAEAWTVMVLNPDFTAGIGGWYKALGDPSTALSWDAGTLTWNTPAAASPYVAFNSNTFPIVWPAGVTRFRMRVAWRGTGGTANLALVSGPNPIDTVWRPPGDPDPSTPPVRTVASDVVAGVQGVDALWRASVVVDVANPSGDGYLGFLWRVSGESNTYAPRVEYAYLEHVTDNLGDPLTCNVDAVTIRYGREGNTDQPDAMACTLDVSADPDTPLDAAVDIGSRITVTADDSTGAPVTRFVGRVTDVTYAWEGDAADTASGQIVAVGRLADTGRATVSGTFTGSDSQQVRALMAAAAIPVTADPGAVNLNTRVVAPQEAVSGPLGAVLEDTFSTLWERPDGSLWWASMTHRDAPPASLVQLDACDIDLSPEWRRDLDGVANVVTVVYGPDVAEGDRASLTAYDADSAETWGQYAAVYDTQLRAIGDASAVAAQRLYWHGAPGWQLNTIPLTLDGMDAALSDAVLALAMHDVLELVDLPAVAGRPDVPTRVIVFVEGWDESITYGSHTITLNVTPAKDPDAYVTPGSVWDFPVADVGDRTAAPITPWPLSDYATFTDGRYRWDGEKWVPWVASGDTWAAAVPAWAAANGSWDTWINQ